MGYTFDDECRMCGKKTKAVVNINMKAVAICNSCCNGVMLQHAHWLAENACNAEKTTEVKDGQRE